MGEDCLFAVEHEFVVGENFFSLLDGFTGHGDKVEGSFEGRLLAIFSEFDEFGLHTLGFDRGRELDLLSLGRVADFSYL